MGEIRKVKTQVAGFVYVHELPDFLDERRVAVRRESHHLELVSVFGKTEELRDRQIQETQRMREEHAILDGQARTTSNTTGRADEIAEAIDRAEIGIFDWAREEAARQVRRVMLHVVDASGHM